MAINSTPWTALVDDDGSNLVGTVWNKAAIKTVCLDPALSTLCVGPQVVVPSLTGIYYNYRPTNGENIVIWQLSPSGAVDLTGILAEAPGTTHLLVNGGSPTITMHNQHTGSAAGNRIICPGYANFNLTAWMAIWVVYLGTPQNSWLGIKA